MKLLSFSAVRLCLFAILFLTPFEVWGGIFTNATSNNEYNDPANWNPAGVPAGGGSIAEFNASFPPITVSTLGFGGLFVGQFLFDLGGGANNSFEFILGLNNFDFIGNGIVNNDPPNIPTLTVTSGPLTFANGSTAGNSNIIINGGSVSFNDNSMTETSTITNNATLNLNSAELSPGATIINNGGGQVNINTLAEVGSISGAGGITLTNDLSVGALDQNDTISGVIDGAGGLTKVGTEILTLSGVNTYMGGTTISEGTLSVDNDGNLGDAAGDLTFDGGALQNTATFASPRGVFVNAGGGTVNTNGNDLTLSGVIADGVGAGEFIKDGDGTLTLSGANTYSGGMRLRRATVAVTNPDSIGTGDLTFDGAGTTLQAGAAGLNLANAATLVSDGIVDTNGNALELSGAIGGANGLIKSGAGILTLSNVGNNYTGPTTVNNGTLQGTVSVASALTVTNPGVFNLTASQAIGSLAGNGGVTLNAFNLSTGGNNTSTTYSGVMSGTGGLIKEGTGNFTLTGAQTFTGPTTVAGGKLTNNGSLASTVTVNSGAFYAGNGSSGTLVNNGTVSPGNSIGTIIVNGNYIQGPGGALDIEITPKGLTDLLQITGTATLNGTLNILPLGRVSSFVHRTYTFLTAAGGVSGQFATVTPVSGLQFTINYLPNAVQLIIQGSNFSSLVTSGNAGIIASYLDQIVANGTVSPDLDTVLNALSDAADQGTSALTAALNQISPDPHREMGFLSFDQTNLLRQSISNQQQRLIDTYVLKTLDVDEIASESLASFQNHLQGRNLRGGFQPMNFNAKAPRRSNTAKDRLAALSFSESSAPVRKMVQIGKSNVWIEPAGQYQKKKNSSPLVGTKNHTYGTTVGADTLVAPNTYVGILGSIMNTHFDWTQHRGKGSVNGYFGGVYALWLSETGFYLDGQATIGGERYKARRNINFQTINRTARSKHNGVTVATDLEAGYLWTLGKTLIQPFFNFAYSAAHEGSFNEKGADSLNAHLNSKTSQFSRTELGPILSYFFTTCDETIIYPSAKLSWVQKRPWGNKGKREKFNFTDQTFGTTVYGDNRVRNMISPGLSLTAQFKNGLYVTGDVNAEAGSGERLGQVMLNLGYNF